MVTIIIISNDPHVMLLKERFQPLIKGQICIFSDFEQGLMAVFDKRPVSVFIQREIDGTAADVIARQIKGLLREGSPRLILMGALEGTKQDGVQCFDDSFDFAASDDELCAFFGAQLEKIPYLLWRDGIGPSEWVPANGDAQLELTAVNVSDASLVSDPFKLQKSDNLADHAHISTQQLTNWGEADKSQVNPSSSTATSSADSRISSPARNHDSRLGSMQDSGSSRKTQSLPRQTQPKSKIVAGSGAAKDDFSSFGWGRQRYSQQHRIWPYVIGVFIAAALASTLYMSELSQMINDLFNRYSLKEMQQPVKKSVPVVLPLSSTARQSRISSLPGIIPPNGKDLVYSSTHPGWERFVSEDVEFLVFRSGNGIKAIQLIASNSTGISDGMISSIIGQLTGTSSYSITGSSTKNGYLLQQSKLSGGAELVIYRKKSNAQIRGVVVTAP